MLSYYDFLFTVFHWLFIMFVLIGWGFPKTQNLHLGVLCTTLIAWFAIGYFKNAIGYCPLTDWHWDLKRSMGQRILSGSFVQDSLLRYSPIRLSRIAVDTITALGLLWGCAMAFYNFIGRHKAKEKTKSTGTQP